jgi:hypothetical protein
MTWLPGLALAVALLTASDSGGPITPAQATEITPDATTNLGALLHDRPELLMLFQPRDEIWTWLAVHFSNGGWTIRWSNDQSRLEHYLARHTYAADGHPVIFIERRLKKSGNPISAEAQLSGLVFELLNAEHEGEFRDLAARASRGEIARPAFVLANAQIEFEVCRGTQEFYRAVWRPHALRAHVPEVGGNWHLAIGTDFAKWIVYHRQVSRDGYPDDVYGPEYDAIMRRRRAEEKSPAASSGDTQR